MELPNDARSALPSSVSSSSASSGDRNPPVPEGSVSEKEGNASIVDVVAKLEEPATRRRVVADLRNELEEADCFWAKLEDHATETCGDDLSVPVVSAFKGIHTRRLGGLNLEQVDSVCRDVLASMIKKAERT
ncbi:conserved hypothetical protein [Neospora caninum Liverpool]|uniref:Uncharacterized protein n=1 Tax=Neospora caninum (strain Liverpool) TaxID=572307 RepID=F0VRH3_NEOCL|nr:conserved hypothetical protein [Neospora caninum Liverpool]CBZ56321.1 conserved hypothetical protein [Neospora caninum Liverpool]CEL71081.1 TPA: hypothetical protein BN1204_067460 [Neospora caninum Liverpool]|eukprot:XP_003886346.1 conserved hypothetical protein [Neospora caninum Liverpool]